MINITKSLPEPSDLAAERTKRSGEYRTDGVLKRLRADFFNKCYICEYKNPTTINVEHFVPHKGNLELKLDWNNLFWSCAHCNNIKLGNFDNMLNCTVLEDDVENAIKLSLELPFATKQVTVTSLNDDVKTLTTADLLHKVYNGTTVLKSIESHYIRESLSKELLEFIRLINDYYTAHEDNYKEILKAQIGAQLHSSSAFTGFKRWIVKDDPILFEEFGSNMITSA